MYCALHYRNKHRFASTVLCTWRNDQCKSLGLHQWSDARRYVPCEWGHAVLNVQDTIGVAVEFKYRYSDGT